MFSSNVIIKNRVGLHSRPATELVIKSNRFQSEICLKANGVKADAKNIMSVLSARIRRGTIVTVEASGIDEEIAVKELISYLESLQED